MWNKSGCVIYVNIYTTGVSSEKSKLESNVFIF